MSDIRMKSVSSLSVGMGCERNPLSSQPIISRMFCDSDLLVDNGFSSLRAADDVGIAACCNVITAIERRNSCQGRMTASSPSRPAGSERLLETMAATALNGLRTA